MMKKYINKILSNSKDFFLHNKGPLFLILTAIVLIFNFINPIIDQAKIFFSKKGTVDLINISINENGESPVLDMKFINTTDEVVYFYKAEFIIQECVGLSFWDPYCYNVVEPSKDYDVILAENGVSEYSTEFVNNKFVSSFTQDFDISQAIPPNDVDRFTFSLSSLFGSGSIVIYHFSIKFYYNSDKYIESDDIIVLLVNNRDDTIRFTDDDIIENYQTLLYFHDYDAIISDRLAKLFKGFEKAYEEITNDGDNSDNRIWKYSS